VQKESWKSWLSVEKRARYFKVLHRLVGTRFYVPVTDAPRNKSAGRAASRKRRAAYNENGTAPVAQSRSI
jgi:hypothetical protein